MTTGLSELCTRTSQKSYLRMFVNLQRFSDAATEIFQNGLVRKAIFKVDRFVSKSLIKAKECRKHSLERMVSKELALFLNDFDRTVFRTAILRTTVLSFSRFLKNASQG